MGCSLNGAPQQPQCHFSSFSNSYFTPYLQVPFIRLKYEFENEDIQIKREYLREYQDVNDPQKDISKVLSDNFDIDNGNY